MKQLLLTIEHQIKNKPTYRGFEDQYFMCLETMKTDERPGADFLHRLSDLCEWSIVNDVWNEDELLKVYSLHKQILRTSAPIIFEDYLLYVEWNREPEKKFYLPRRKVLKEVVWAMQDLIDDKLDLLTISMPPGTGKSTLGIFFLSWVMGKYPDNPNLASAHSGILTRSFFDGVLQIITDPEYLWSDVFHLDVANTNTKEETIDLGKFHRFSTLTCRAINASLTGATRCEKILYADDLVSGIEEAMNKERLDKLWISYTNDLKSRKKMGAKEIHIATRWSVHDPIGRLEQQYGDDPRAKFIVLAALDENGKSNFNYQYGVGFDTKYFEDMASNLDDASFKALFMNQPIEREGLLYHEDELQRYFSLPDGEPDSIFAVCDTKDKGTDFCVMPVVYQYGQRYFIEDFICDNSNPDVVEGRLIQTLLKHHTHAARFESNSAGGRVAQKVQEGIRSKGGRTSITTKFSTANKETRIILASGYAKEHFLFKDKSVASKEYRKALSFLCGYTMAGKNKNDDVPDAIAMLVDYIDTMGGATVEIVKRPF